MNNESSFFDCLGSLFSLQFLEFLQALLTPLIAMYLAYIAYRQWRTNNDNLRERLFDRRMEVFDMAFDAISTVLREGLQETSAERTLAIAWQKSKFLFGPDVTNFLDEARNNILKGNMYYKLLDAPNQDRADIADKEYSCFQKVTKDIEKMWAVFDPYLSFRQRG